MAQAAATVQDRCRNDQAETLSGFFVPGRIEVLGKHNDYAGGASVLAAAEQGFILVCSARDDCTVRVTDVRCGETIEFPLDGEIVPTVGHWSNYPMTVARRLARNFPETTRGTEIAFASDLPPASGMSSSSAMIVAFYLALADVNPFCEAPQFKSNISDRVELASYLATVENGQNFGSLEGDRGVGTAGGSEDHTAILCCRPGLLSQYAYCPARHLDDVGLPEPYTFVIGASGVVAEKTGSAMAAYNRASRLAQVAAETWREATGRSDPHLAAAVASCPGDPEEVRRVLLSAPLSASDVTREQVLTRFDHFYLENEQLLPASIGALKAGDMAALGDFVAQSQKACEELLGNQIPETVFLAGEARQLGAAAACAFGAGFGGSVWALVEKQRTADFLTAWSESYLQEFAEHKDSARFFQTDPAPASMRIV
jgi:galactokinase